MSAEDSVNLVVTITQKDCIAAMRAMSLRQVSKLSKVLFCISVGFSEYLVYQLGSSRAISFAWALLFPAGLALFVVFVKFGAPLLNARNFVRRNPNALLPVNQTVGPNGVTGESSLGHATANWDAYQRVVETRDAFLLFSLSNFAVIAPKRCFRGPEDIQKYRQIVRRYCPGILELQDERSV